MKRSKKSALAVDWSDLESKTSYVELPSGLIVPDHVVQSRPKAVDLFCGCGGFSLGMIEGGFEVVAACDNDPQAAITYFMNLGQRPVQFHFIEPCDEARMEKALLKSMGLTGKPDCWLRRHGTRIIEPPVAGSGYLSSHPDKPGVSHFFFGDASKLTGEAILHALGMKRGELDCVCGSPPCQGFSFAGKRNVLDPRNSLVFDFIRLVIELHPKTMVFENVPGIASMITPDGIPVVDSMCRILEDGGFGTFNAMKRALAAQAGSGGLVRSRVQPNRASKTPPPAKRNAVVQRSLFA
jgi:DNA (cytosine-5)-methyltransferase 1